MADGVGGMATDGVSPGLMLSSSAVLAFRGGGAGAGVHGAGAGVHRRAGDGRDILLDPTAMAMRTATDLTAMAPRTVTTAGMVMEAPATDPTATAPNMITTADMAMEIPATVMGTATDLVTAMQVNTAPQLIRK